MTGRRAEVPLETVDQMTLVGMAACYFPARRAMRLDPMVALRGD